MKNEILDILILGLLVVLFASIYRKRVSARLRCWVIGWILVLAHFTAQLLPAASTGSQEFVDSLGISTLLLSGCASSSPPLSSWRPRWVTLWLRSESVFRPSSIPIT